MRNTLLRLIWLLVSVVPFGSPTWCDEPVPEQWVPQPQILSSSNLLLSNWQFRPMPGQRDYWNYLSVDSRGRFRPRVVQTPFGSYYQYNLQPYPWSNLNQTFPRFVSY